MSGEKRQSAVSKKIRRRNTTLAVFVIVVLVAVCLFTPLFDISSISVTGNTLLTDDAIIKASGIKKGDNLFLINTKKVKKGIDKLGYIESFEINRKFFARVELEVVETPEAAYLTFSGNYVGINKDGKILSVTKATKLKPAKAVVTGYALKSAEVGAQIECKKGDKTELLKLVLEAISNSGKLDMIKNIDVSDKDNIVFAFTSGTKVVLGDDTQLEYKLKCLDAVMAELGEIRGGKINVSDPANVIYEGGN